MKTTDSVKTAVRVLPKYLQYNNIFGVVVGSGIICVLISAAFISVQKRCSGVPLSDYSQCLPASKIHLK
jgi:hypothetical protein